MSANSFHLEEKRAIDLYTREVVADYTVKTGRTADSFVFDRVITINSPAAAFTLTVPDGTYEGQRLLIILQANTGSYTVTVTATTGTDYTLTTAATHWVEIIWTGGTGGWLKVAGTTAT